MGKRVGLYIQELRQQQGLSIRELSNQLELSHAHLSLVERGQREISIQTLFPIIHALGGNFANAMRLLAIDAGVPEEAIPQSSACQVKWPAIVTNSG